MKPEPEEESQPIGSTAFRWSNTFNLGQVISGIMVVVTLVGLYYAIIGRMDKQEMRLGSQQEMIARMENVTSKLVDSQNSIAQTLAVLTSKVEDNRRVSKP